MAYTFNKLEVWQMAAGYIDMIYKIAELLPRNEEYNLRSRMVYRLSSVV